MKLTKNTILITGGSSGIGLELSRQLLQLGNNVLICGRSKEKLEQATLNYPKLQIFQCDLSNYEECVKLAEWVKEEHPDCNMVVNNAAIVHNDDFLADPEIIKIARLEFQTNTLAPITLANLLMPVILTNPNPVLVNVTTGLVFAPKAAYPFYCATKAALHSFTQGLRFNMKDVNVKIVEAFFPAVDTPWHQGKPPKIAISVEKAVREMVLGLEKEREEIFIGKVKLIRLISRIAPGFAFRKINSLE